MPVGLLIIQVSLMLVRLSDNSTAADWPMGRANSMGTGATQETLPENLELLWEVNIEGLGFDAGPIIAEQTVYANDQDGRVVALDLKTGEEKWRVELSAAGFVAAPAFQDGTLFVCDDAIRALNASDGSERWHFATGNQISASPNFFDDSVIVTSEDGILYRIKKESGELVWKYETEAPILCGASIAGDLTFLGGCDEKLHVVDLKTGKVVGEPKVIGPTASTPGVSGEHVLIPTQQGAIFSFRTSDMSESWRYEDQQVAREFRNSLAIADGLAVAASDNKRVFALDVETGEMKWVQILRMRSDASPIISGQNVIIAAADGRILRYELKTGKELWMFEVKRGFIGPPAVADGKLVLTNSRGSIFCFGERK